MTESSFKLIAIRWISDGKVIAAGSALSLAKHKTEPGAHIRAEVLGEDAVQKRMYERTLAEAAAASGLTVPEADVHSFLQENPEFDTARDVALYREVSRAYVSKAVELLVQRKYIKIQQDKDDRRLQHLIITDKAREAAEILRKAQYAFYGKVTTGLTQEELFGMLGAIAKCAGNLE